MCQKQALKYTILDVQKELEKGTRKLFTYVQGDVLSHERIYIRHGGKKKQKKIVRALSCRHVSGRVVFSAVGTAWRGAGVSKELLGCGASHL